MLHQPGSTHSTDTAAHHSSSGTSTSSSSQREMCPSLMLQLAAAVERQATHPVAKALVAAAAADRKASANTANPSSSSTGQEQQEQQPLLEKRAGTSSSSKGGKQHQHSSSKGSSSSSDKGGGLLSPHAAAVLAAGGQLEPDSGSFLQEPGSGAVAAVAGHKVSVGTLEWVQRHGAQLSPIGQQLLQDSSSGNAAPSSSSSGSSQHEPLTGHTQVYVGVDDMIVGLVDVADVIRPDARSTVQELHDQGIRTVMLSGAFEYRPYVVARFVSRVCTLTLWAPFGPSMHVDYANPPRPLCMLSCVRLQAGWASVCSHSISSPQMLEYIRRTCCACAVVEVRVLRLRCCCR